MYTDHTITPRGTSQFSLQLLSQLEMAMLELVFYNAEPETIFETREEIAVFKDMHNKIKAELQQAMQQRTTV